MLHFVQHDIGRAFSTLSGEGVDPAADMCYHLLCNTYSHTEKERNGAAHQRCDEATDVLSRPRIRAKYHLENGDIETVLRLILLCGEMVTPNRQVTTCRDPLADRFLEVAVDGKADVVVRGDEDLALNPFAGIPFIGPAAFLERLERPHPVHSE
jgi:putative PIN family toxin of toxin-antitoxin system